MVAGMGFWMGASNNHSSGVESFVEEINTLRESLAQGVSGKATADTFAAVCKPVGMKAKAVAQENQWTFRQVSNKYRNPDNKATSAEAEAIQVFEQDKTLLSFWDDGETSASYYRRITVQESCLTCHGDMKARPDFIKEKYPEDLAHSFEAGELRGIFSVTVRKN